MQRPVVSENENEIAPSNPELVRSLHIVPADAFMAVQQHALAQEAAAMDVRDEFISLASHELKTPLTALLLEVELQKRRLNRSQLSTIKVESVSQLISAIDRHAWHLNRLIEDMLESAKLSNGRIDLEEEEVDLSVLVQDVANRYSAEISSSGSTLELDLQPLMIGYWDRDRIEQVLSHLLRNAVKYGAGQPIRISVSQSGDVATLKVKDQGIGIPSDSLERIFERFERAVSADHVSGLGLGLYISRKIVEMHGGQIWAESSLQQGSTFSVTLPTNKECAS